MSRTGMVVVCFAAMMSVTRAIAKEGFGGGLGTQESPWMIADAAQLDQLRSFLGTSHANHYFALACDIDLAAYLSPGGDGYSKWGAAGWEPIGYPLPWPDRSGSFCGKLDGNGHQVTGLWARRETQVGVGLFGCTDEGCELLNIGVAADESHGGVRGRGDVGGVVGEAFNSSLINVRAVGPVSGSGGIGGLIGMVERTVISNCCAVGAVSADPAGYGGVGGLAGLLHNGLIVSSCAECQVYGRYSAGGLVGDVNSYGTVLDCYAKGAVSGTASIGGIAGSNSGVIAHVYAMCAAAGDSEVGGIVGKNLYGALTVESSFFDVQAAGVADGVGGGYSLGGGYGRTTAEMRRRSTFVGWDFAAVWDLCEGFAAPVFRWQPLAPAGVRVKGFSAAPGTLAFAWEDVGEKVPVVYGKTRLSDGEWAPLTNGVGVTVEMRSDGATLIVEPQGEASPYRFFTVIIP